MIQLVDIPIMIFWAHLVWFGNLSLGLKFECAPTIGSWDIPLLIFSGCSPLEVFFILRKCKIWLEYTSSCWDIPLSIFLGHLPLEGVFNLTICKIWFGHLILSLEFEYDPTIGSWDIQLLKYLGLPLKVFFMLRICQSWFGHQSLSLKFENDPTIGSWDIPLKLQVCLGR